MAATIKKPKTTKMKPLRPAAYATDWPAYERGQQARGAHIVLLMSELQAAPEPVVFEGKRPAHRPCIYSDETIYAMCFLKLVLRQPFRALYRLLSNQTGRPPTPDVGLAQANAARAHRTPLRFLSRRRLFHL